MRVFYLFVTVYLFLPKARTGRSETHEEEEACENKEDCREKNVDNQSDGGHGERVLQLILNSK